MKEALTGSRRCQCPDSEDRPGKPGSTHLHTNWDGQSQDSRCKDELIRAPELPELPDRPCVQNFLWTLSPLLHPIHKGYLISSSYSSHNPRGFDGGERSQTHNGPGCCLCLPVPLFQPQTLITTMVPVLGHISEGKSPSDVAAPSSVSYGRSSVVPPSVSADVPGRRGQTGHC